MLTSHIQHIALCIFILWLLVLDFSSLQLGACARHRLVCLQPPSCEVASASLVQSEDEKFQEVVQKLGRSSRESWWACRVWTPVVGLFLIWDMPGSVLTRKQWSGPFLPHKKKRNLSSGKDALISAQFFLSQGCGAGTH